MDRRVLIVEDEIINAMALCTLLPLFGFTVVDTATSGEDAIRLSETKMPDVVLMDITLHGPIDGLDAARQIIALGIPVVFMTGHDDKETLRRAEELKPLAFLVKPLNVDQLRNCLEEHFGTEVV